MEKEQIDWDAYHNELVNSLANERIWELGCLSEYNPHTENVENIQEELDAIEHSDYEMIINKYADTPEYFNDYLN